MKKRQKKISNKEIKPGVIKYVNEDTNQVKKFALILIGVALIAVLLYFVTAKYLVKDKYQPKTESETTITISYDTVRLGNVFNRPYDEYYVIAYDSTGSRANYFKNLTKEDEENKFYFLDLSLDVNKSALKETGNPKATKPSELAIVDPTLILIKDGKISKYYEGEEKIVSVLK